MGGAGHDRLRRIFEYQMLVTRQRELQIPLSAAEEARLKRLADQLGEAVPQLDERDQLTLLPEAWRASFALGGRFGSGRVLNASGAGVAIATAQAPSVGERLTLDVWQPGHAVEYTFPGYVVWRVVRGTPSIGVAFHGVPSETTPNRRRASGVFPTDAVPDDNGDEKRKTG